MSEPEDESKEDLRVWRCGSGQRGRVRGANLVGMKLLVLNSRMEYVSIVAVRSCNGGPAYGRAAAEERGDAHRKQVEKIALPGRGR